MSILYVHTQGAQLRLQAGRFVVLKGDEKIAAIPEVAVDCVVLLGNIQTSTQAVHALLDRGIPLLYLARSGRFKGILQPGFPRDAHIRFSQYEAFLDLDWSLAAARCTVEAKIAAQQATIRKWARNRWIVDSTPAERIADFSEHLETMTDRASIRAVEASASVAYYKLFAQALPAPFVWQGRNRRPPLDPVNSLLSFTYMLAVGEAVGVCYALGLDPLIGLLHEMDHGRPSLALDLIEPVRSLCCDHFVLRQLHSDSYVPEDFSYDEEEGCRFMPDALSRHITAFEQSTLGGIPVRQALRNSLTSLAKALREAIRSRNRPEWSALVEAGLWNT
jgi:CRISPR-associated protein Cas1